MTPGYRTLILNALAYVDAGVLENFESGVTSDWTTSNSAWTFGGTTNTSPNLPTKDGAVFARSGAPNVAPGNPLAESNTGTITSPPLVVTGDILRWNAAGWSGPSYDGQSYYQILDGTFNVKATIPVPESDPWVTLTTDLLAAGLQLGDTFYFRAVDAKAENNYAWMAFDKLTLRRTVPPRQTPAITWNNPADIVYGAVLGAAQLNATADVAGPFTYAPGAGTVLNAGAAQTLSVDFVPDDYLHYRNATKSVLINVAQAPQTPLEVHGAPVSAIDGTSFAVSYTGGSGSGTAALSVLGPCSLNATTVTMTGGSGVCRDHRQQKRGRQLPPGIDDGVRDGAACGGCLCRHRRIGDWRHRRAAGVADDSSALGGRRDRAGTRGGRGAGAVVPRSVMRGCCGCACFRAVRRA